LVGHGFDIPVSGPLAVPESVAAIARGGEELGFTHAFTSDHIVIPTSFESIYPYTADGSAPFGTSFLELLTTITYMAAVTSKVRLVTSVMVMPYRAPMHTAKVLSTIDVLSQGRLTVGVGVGWMREEFESVNAPPFEARGRVTDEYIHAFRELWSVDEPNANGEFVNFSNVVFEPKPVQSPLPIWIGGESPPAIRRAATLGDGWYPVSFAAANPLDTLERFTASLDKLHALAREAGRNPGEIEITYHAGVYDRRDTETLAGGDRKAFTGSDGQIADDIKRFEEAGVSNIFWLFPGDTAADLLGSMERYMDGVAKG